MAEVMTDKAAVEVPSPVSGRVVAIHGQAGDVVRVGSELIVFETESTEDLAAASAAEAEPAPEVPPTSTETPQPAPAAGATMSATEAGEVQRIKASPATRRKARGAGLDLRLGQGSGPSGRI